MEMEAKEMFTGNVLKIRNIYMGVLNITKGLSYSC